MGIEEAVDYLRKITQEKVEFEKDDFVEFDRREKGEVYAIDGGSVKLFDAYSFSVYARRTGYVFANERKILERGIEEIKIDFIFEENADAVNDERREAEEIAIAEKLSGLVLMDGCLKEKREGIVGISKKSGLKDGNIPLLFLIKKFGDKIMPDKCWYYEIDDGIYAVKFHPYSRFAFRVDYFGNDVEEIFAEIAAFCNDVSCIGYPYALAEVHKLVKIGREDAEYLKYSLLHNAIQKGMSMEELEDLFYDYHEYLEG